MKVWVLAESKTGYIWKSDLYTGKVDNQDNDLPLGTCAVLSLTSDLFEKGYHIFFDNFYTKSSLTYADCFMRKACEGCGTVRPNRKGIQNRLKTIVLRRV